MLMTSLLLPLLPLSAHGQDKPAVCALAEKSIVSRSAAGIAQVSNLGDIEIRCSVPTRPFPSKPGESRSALRATTATYEVSTDGREELAPSEVHQTGGGFDAQREWVLFYLHIQLDPAEADGEARRLLEKLNEAAKQTPGSPGSVATEEALKQAAERHRDLVYQHRLGRFRVQCRLSAEDKVTGVGQVELEVLYKGRFSDAGLPGAPPM